MADTDLDRLLTVTRDQGTDPDLAWKAGLAAVELLLWHDEPVEAGNLAEEVLGRFAATCRGLVTELSPLVDAIVVASVRDQQDPANGVTRIADMIPADSVLARHLQWMAERLPDRDPFEFCANAQWHRPPRPLRPREAAFADRDPTTLEPAERDRLWKAAHHSGQFPVARRLWDATGEAPPRAEIATWMAGHMAHDEELAAATLLLQQAADMWRPSLTWDVVPYEFMIQPLLRAAVTDELHAAITARVDLSPILEADQ
ncbi:hypothetical protein BJF85_07930 [Saccharomonospora sp. CUA-673]|uniref:hypothetical protein n=1 Tax=Saccharomonospora sp. CUA-673 TaxID=1904969 RepID=UPI000966C9D7|nr:hypothetical protein [Saccharomonospora sp. CUA-673]OLT39115.1 hypothetical protein BJF85_07930 [Saccharomonospora sp. CUA-673]